MIKPTMLVESDKRHIPVPEGARCFSCGKPADTMHHIIPYSYGGRIGIPMCTNCHHIAHHGKGTKHHHGDLIKKGLKKAKQSGKKLGPPDTVNKDHVAYLLVTTDMSYSQICEEIGCSKTTVCRVNKKYNLRTKDV